MRRFICMMLVLTLCLAGCRAGTDTDETTNAPTETTVTPVETTAPAEETLEWTEVTEPETTPVIGTEAGGEQTLAFADPGKARIRYERNVSYVKYITSVEDLPESEALAAYDKTFFETHALVLVVETVSSGSVQLEIDSITVEGGTASVALSREMSGAVGTADMATWMLWAEVERGLDCTWVLENASTLPGGEKY